MTLALTMLIDGLQYAAFLFIVSLGLTLTFGVMRVLNLANGAVYAWGAYVSALAIGYLAFHGWPIVIVLGAALALSLVVGSLLGLIIERFVIRSLYGKDEIIPVIATFGLLLVLENLILMVFGVESYLAYQPMAYFGTIELFGVLRDVYSLLLILLAFVVGIVVWLFLARTQRGRLLVAVIEDPEISAAMGIRVKRTSAITFAVGSALSAFAGGVVAPTISVTPGFSLDVIVLSLAVVVIGGLGSIPGTMISALIIGILRAFSAHLYPQFEFFVVFAVMAAILLVRPQGLVPPAQMRRI